MATSAPGYKSWTEIASLPADQQASRIRHSYESLAQVAPAGRPASILELERGLYALTDNKIRAFDRSRLQALLALQPDTAGTATATYPSLLDKMAGSTAMKHATMIMNIGHEFSAAEQIRLRVFFPRAFTSKAESCAPTVFRPAAVSAPDQPAKSRWAFWKKA